ncbi:MAG: 16S rRNA (cytidine(1402)-2'-O)-methyltransferase [Gammaproteobacteria bacterium]|nr:16S rRNA (cytidine(1402)-2'-O)-methyltransferase [Gammaproteobacteria bacterium]
MIDKKNGQLYVVATPIGNLQDITFRAIEVLKNVDVIAAEDTRHAGRLLNHYAIKKSLISLHEWNEQERLNQIIAYLEEGKQVALISDAGTPLLSDPGYLLVQAVWEKGLTVTPIPGPSAVITALCASGLPSHQFRYEGFLPAKEEACRKHLVTLAGSAGTLIFYEGPHRLLATLKVMQSVFGADREAVVARELTKMYETFHRGTLTQLVEEFTQKVPRGEIVILVKGCETAPVIPAQFSVEKILGILCKELPLKQAVSLTAQITGERKNSVYKSALDQEGL